MAFIFLLGITALAPAAVGTIWAIEATSPPNHQTGTVKWPGDDEPIHIRNLNANNGYGPEPPFKLPVIAHINTTNIRGKDLEKIRTQGVKAEVTGEGTAKFTVGTAVSQGNFTIEKGHSEDGLAHGALSFHIPGIEGELEGKFVIVNHTTAQQKVKDDFDNVMQWLQEDHSEMNLGEAVASIAKAL